MKLIFLSISSQLPTTAQLFFALSLHNMMMRNSGGGSFFCAAYVPAALVSLAVMRRRGRARGEIKTLLRNVISFRFTFFSLKAPQQIVNVRENETGRVGARQTVSHNYCLFKWEKHTYTGPGSERVLYGIEEEKYYTANEWDWGCTEESRR